MEDRFELEWELFLNGKNSFSPYRKMIENTYNEVKNLLNSNIVDLVPWKKEIRAKNLNVEIEKTNKVIFCRNIVGCFPNLDNIKMQVLLYLESHNESRINEAINVYNNAIPHFGFKIPSNLEVNNSLLTFKEEIFKFRNEVEALKWREKSQNVLEHLNEYEILTIDEQKNYIGIPFVQDDSSRRRIVYPIFRLKKENTINISDKEILKLWIENYLIPIDVLNFKNYTELFNSTHFNLDNDSINNNRIEIEEIYEDDGESLEEELFEHPFSIKDISVKVSPLTMTNLITRLKYDEIDLNPDFQRNGDLWNRKKMSRLIESILLRLPLPIFYFDVSDRDKWVVIDGLQRLSTIKKFVVEDNLKLGHLEFLTDLNGQKFSELDRKYKRELEEANITTYQVEANTPKEVRYSIFNRINTGGMTLNSQEVRQALNQKGYGVKFLKEVVGLEEFKRIVKIRSKRMTDRELVLRYIGFSMGDYNEFLDKGITLSTFIDNTMEEIDKPDFKKESFDYLKKSLIDSLVFLEELFPIGAIFNKTLADKTKTKTLNRSLFEVWTVLSSKLSYEQRQQLLSNKTKVISEYSALLRSVRFDEAITKGTNDRSAVRTRFNLLDQFLKGILK